MTDDDVAAEIKSLKVNVEILQKLTRDHAERFETLQTPWWKRLAFWINGWPWYDLNGTQRRRPWHRRSTPDDRKP